MLNVYIYKFMYLYIDMFTYCFDPKTPEKYSSTCKINGAIFFRLKNKKVFAHFPNITAGVYSVRKQNILYILLGNSPGNFII